MRINVARRVYDWRLRLRSGPWQRRMHRLVFLASSLIGALACFTACGSFLQLQTYDYGMQRKPLYVKTMMMACAPGRPAPVDELEEHTIEMKDLIDGSVGVAVTKGKCSVSSLKSQVAYMAGWRVDDDIIMVNADKVTNNKELRKAVQKALRDHSSKNPIKFVVKRKKAEPPPDSTRSMLTLLPTGACCASVDLKALLQQVMKDYSAVLFLDGPPELDGVNPSAEAVEALMRARVAFKLVDCADEDPDVRTALDEIIGETSELPQLFVGGKLVGGGAKVLELSHEGKLRKRVLELGALDWDDKVDFLDTFGDRVTFKLNQRGLLDYYKGTKRIYTYVTMLRIVEGAEAPEVHFRGISLITRKRSLDIRVRPAPETPGHILPNVEGLFQRRGGYLR